MESRPSFAQVEAFLDDINLHECRHCVKDCGSGSGLNYAIQEWLYRESIIRNPREWGSSILSYDFISLAHS